MFAQTHCLINNSKTLLKPSVYLPVASHTHTHTHTHIHIYIYIYVCVCVCVCVYTRWSSVTCLPSSKACFRLQNPTVNQISTTNEMTNAVVPPHPKNPNMKVRDSSVTYVCVCVSNHTEYVCVCVCLCNHTKYICVCVYACM